jgi:hypothetical protein
MRIDKSVRLFELEGTIALLEPTAADDGYLGMTVHLEDGSHMSLPHPSNYDFPVDLDDGIDSDGKRDAKKATRIAVRSFLVPTVDRKSGVVSDVKRYVFAPDDGIIDLAHCQTRDEYLAIDYTGKPKLAVATAATEAF